MTTTPTAPALRDRIRGAALLPGDPGFAEATQLWNGAIRKSQRCRRFSTGNYINFQSADEGEGRIRESYGANFGRLAALKARYDPENRLRSNRNIAPAAGEGPGASK